MPEERHRVELVRGDVAALEVICLDDGTVRLAVYDDEGRDLPLIPAQLEPAERGVLVRALLGTNPLLP